MTFFPFPQYVDIMMPPFCLIPLLYILYFSFFFYPFSSFFFHILRSILHFYISPLNPLTSPPNWGSVMHNNDIECNCPFQPTMKGFFELMVRVRDAGMQFIWYSWEQLVTFTNFFFDELKIINSYLLTFQLGMKMLPTWKLSSLHQRMNAGLGKCI